MPTLDTYPRLLADVGGTNARFAWQTGPNSPPHGVRSLPASAHDSLLDAVQSYLQLGGHGPAAQACIAIATAVQGDLVRMTNHHWSFSTEALRQQLGLQRLLVINDFTALALALPSLGAHDLHLVGGSPQTSPALGLAPLGLIGPGTGLGVSGLLPDGAGGWVPLRGEGGHVSLPASNPREQAVAELLWQRFGHASAERAVSGQGLSNLCGALHQLEHGQWPDQLPSPAEISARGLSGQDPLCAEVLAQFCAHLGSIAGNLALTLGATGGVYIGGGIVPRLGDWFERSPFRERFESKGRFAAYLAPIPVWVITADPSPALLGAARALQTPGLG